MEALTTIWTADPDDPRLRPVALEVGPRARECVGADRLLNLRLRAELIVSTVIASIAEDHGLVTLRPRGRNAPAGVRGGRRRAHARLVEHPQLRQKGVPTPCECLSDLGAMAVQKLTVSIESEFDHHPVGAVISRSRGRGAWV
jgi:hypothetical protein